MNGLTGYVTTAFEKTKSDRFLLLLLTALIATRCVYLWSFPFFIEGDGYNYYQLLEESRANLLHATGYVFFSLAPKLLAAAAGVEVAGILRYTQHAFSMATVVILYLALTRLMPRWLSFLVCLLLGLDTQLVAAAGTTRPEFFQANLMMLLFSCATFALTTQSPSLKTLSYSATGALLVAGYITKYNFLPALLFCLLPLADQSLNWKSGFRMLGYSAAAGATLFAVFLLGFHYRTTGSFHLNLEHGWIQILKLQDANIPIVPDNGLATKKYMILAEHFPSLGPGSGPWNNVDEVTPEVRAPYRAMWLPLVESTDIHYVNSTYNRLHASLVDRKNYYEPATFFPIYYWLGLHEGEALLGQVFFEGIRRHPTQYLANVWKNFLHSADFRSQYMPYLPVPGIYEPTPEFFKSSQSELFGSRARVFKVVDWSLIHPEDVAAQIWRPGAALFSSFVFLKFVPTTLLWALILAGAVYPVFAIVTGRHLTPANILFITTLLTLTAVMAFSAIIFVFRMKELILCQPLIYILASLAISPWIGLITANKAKNYSRSQLSTRLYS